MVADGPAPDQTNQDGARRGVQSVQVKQVTGAVVAHGFAIAHHAVEQSFPRMIGLEIDASARSGAACVPQPGPFDAEMFGVDDADALPMITIG